MTYIFIIGILCIITPCAYVGREALQAYRDCKLYNRGWNDSTTIAGNLGAFEDLTDYERGIYMKGRRDGWRARVADHQTRRLG